jgi:prepilin-type N-terminal cleavage/methylation domain-containing protein
VKGQGGFTLVELLVAVAVTGLLAVVLGPAVSQLFSVSRYGNDVLTATHELQNAAYWFLYDGRRAVSANVSDGLVLSVGADATVSYRLVDDELRRTSAAGTSILAKDLASVTFTHEGRLVTMAIVAEPAGGEPARLADYTVSLRTDG